MGKQLSLYLDEQEAKRLAEVATRECRRPADQVRFILRRALGIADDPSQAHQTPTDQELQLA